MRAYISVFRMRLKMETQYRGAMIGGIICQMFFGIVLVALYRALFASKAQAMPIEQVTTYVWLQQAFFRMMIATDMDLYDKVKTGNISYDLCRPIDMYWFYYIRICAQKLMGSLMRGIPMMIVACLLPKGWGMIAPKTIPGLLAGLLALFVGLLCMCALENITMAFNMRTFDPRGMSSLLNLLMVTFSGNILPLTLFPDSWQKVITILPYAQLLDAPIRLYTGEYPVVEAPLILLRQAVWTVALVLLGVWFWSSNRKKMIVQGG